MTDVLIIGCNGQLGPALQRVQRPGLTTTSVDIDEMVLCGITNYVPQLARHLSRLTGTPMEYTIEA